MTYGPGAATCAEDAAGARTAIASAIAAAVRGTGVSAWITYRPLLFAAQPSTYASALTPLAEQRQTSLGGGAVSVTSPGHRLAAADVRGRTTPETHPESLLPPGEAVRASPSHPAAPAGAIVPD